MPSKKTPGKVLVLAAVLAIVVMTIACTPDGGSGTTDTIEEKALAAISTSSLTFPTGGPSAVASSFLVPTSQDGLALTWSSSSDLVSKIDPTGQVFLNLPETLAEAARTLELTVTVASTARSVVVKKALTLTLAAPPTTDVEAATTAAAGITDKLLDLSGSDKATDLSGCFTLPLTGAYGTDISWASSNPTVVSVPDTTTGKVTVVTSTTEAKTATLTPTVKRKGTAATKQPAVITVTVPVLTPEKAIEKDLEAAVTTDKIDLAKGDSLSAITKDFALPTSGDRGTDICWVSDSPVIDVATTPGLAIITPEVDKDTEVKLTASATPPTGTTSTAPTKPIVVKVKGASSASFRTVSFDSQTADVAASPPTMQVIGSATTLRELPTSPSKADKVFGG